MQENKSILLRIYQESIGRTQELRQASYQSESQNPQVSRKETISIYSYEDSVVKYVKVYSFIAIHFLSQKPKKE